MKILITGATGFVGGNVAARTQKEGHGVCAIIRNPASRPELESRGISCFADRGSLPEAMDYFERETFDGIIHCASRFQTEHRAEDIHDLISSNIHFPTRLLECAARTNVKWFINTGTIWQHYGNSDYSPVNLYAATKQAFESIAAYYYEAANINFLTLKLSDTYGPHDTRPKIFNLWKRIARTGETLEMSPGEQLIDIVHIDDVVEAYLRAMDILRNDTARTLTGQSFAVTSGHPVRLRDLAGMYARVTGSTLHIEWGKRAYRDREVMVPWNRGRTIPGWQPMVPLEEGISALFRGER